MPAPIRCSPGAPAAAHPGVETGGRRSMLTLDRREFLARAAGVGVAAGVAQLGLPGAPGGLLSSASASASVATQDAGVAPAGPLVLCTLFGGNDGLNTVIPYDVGRYRDWRGPIAIPADQALHVGTFEGVDFGFHPSMTSLQALFAAGKVAVVCGVEYPNPDFSHFQSATIWQTAELSGAQDTGWLGRWLDATGTDPLRALSIGPTAQPALVGARQQAGALDDSTSAGAQLAGQNPTFMAAYRQLMRPYRGQRPVERAVGTAGADLITVGHAAAAALRAERPPGNPSGRDPGDLGTQLAVVAECIRYGLSTDVYAVGLGGFDTHENQLGQHAALLGQLDTAIGDFMADFPAPTARQSPVIVVHSEFGRTPAVNASGGTDHSSASVVLVVGPAVRGGFYGHVPSFTRLDPYGNLIYTTDFRTVYATLLEHVLRFEPARILGRDFTDLGFL